MLMASWIVWSGARTSNDRPLLGSLHPRHISESLDIIVLLWGTRAGVVRAGRDFACSWGRRSVRGPKN
jgi:hypothetical protein